MDRFQRPSPTSSTLYRDFSVRLSNHSVPCRVFALPKTETRYFTHNPTSGRAARSTSCFLSRAVGGVISNVARFIFRRTSPFHHECHRSQVKVSCRYFQCSWTYDHRGDHRGDHYHVCCGRVKTMLSIVADIDSKVVDALVRRRDFFWCSKSPKIEAAGPVNPLF